MGMFGYMTDTETVEPVDTVDVESEGESTDRLVAVCSTQASFNSFCSVYISVDGSRSVKLNSMQTFPFSKGEDMESLLFHFLDDWLFKFSADLFFVPRVSVLVGCHLWSAGILKNI